MGDSARVQAIKERIQALHTKILRMEEASEAADDELAAAMEDLREAKATNHGHCTSCGAPILWGVTEKGKRMPLDAEPAADGTMVVGDDGRLHHITKLAEPLLPIDWRRYHSHHMTCPHGKEWKKSASR